MNFTEIILTVFGCAFVSLFIFMLFKLYGMRKKCFDELSGKPGIYTGPAGEPKWSGHLPPKVIDYCEPRYVYENLEESTEYRPENGRIIGYRISPGLVIHSRVQEQVNFSDVTQYIKRLGGKLLDQEDAKLLIKNWRMISGLREQAGDKTLRDEWFWGTNNGTLAAYGRDNSDELVCFDASGKTNLWFSLILKR